MKVGAKRVSLSNGFLRYDLAVMPLQYCLGVTLTKVRLCCSAVTKITGPLMFLF